MIHRFLGTAMPYLFAASVVLGAIGSLYAYFEGKKVGAQEATAQAQKDLALRISLRDEVQAAVANGLKTIEVKNETIVRNFKTVEREVPVYRDVQCSHPEPVLRLLNDALRGSEVRAQPPVPGQLP